MQLNKKAEFIRDVRMNRIGKSLTKNFSYPCQSCYPCKFLFPTA